MLLVDAMRMLVGVGSDGFLQFTAETVSDIDGPGITDAFVDFLANGAVEYRANNLPASDPAGEYWSNQPETAIGNDYEVALRSVTGDAPDVLAAAVGENYVTISSTRTWGYSAAASRSGTMTFRVRKISDTTDFAEAIITISTTYVP